MERRPITVGEQIAARIDRKGACWLWTGTYATDGYPVFQAASGNISIIPVLWAQENGPIPSGMVLSCTHPRSGSDWCVNPAHHRLRPHGAELATQCRWGHDLTDPSNVWVLRSTGHQVCIACVARRREHSGDKPRRRNKS